MPKLIPLSKQKMKEMGIVQTKKGFMITEKKEVSKNESKEKSSSKKEEVKKSAIQRVTVVEKADKKAERQRLEERGIFND